MQPAGGVYDHEVPHGGDRLLHALPGDLDRIPAVLAVHRNAELGGERFELVGRRRTVHVAGDEQRAPPLLLEKARKLGRGCGLAGALETHQHDDGRDPAGEHEPGLGASHQGRELLQDDLHHHLSGCEALQDVLADGALADGRNKGLDRLEVHVGLEKRHTHFAHGGVDIGLREDASSGELAEDRLQPVREILKHAFYLRGSVTSR